MSSRRLGGQYQRASHNFNYQDYVNTETTSAIGELKSAQIFGFAAAMAVAAIALVALANAALPAKDSGGTTVMIVSDQESMCGPLSTNQDGSVRIGEKSAPTNIRQVIVVEKC
jgi:hypothetical protein